MKKLIRDKIPAIMINNNKKPHTEILTNDDEYLTALNNKLIEETNEYIESSLTNSDMHTQEELADILEVIDTICKLKKYSMSNIIRYKLHKKQKRGGFDQRILLKI